MPRKGLTIRPWRPCVPGFARVPAVRHRYPFEALHWLREQRVDRTARALGESVQRAARARSDASRAEALRRRSEQELSASSAAERSRLGEGLMRAGDLKVVDDWQKAAAAESRARRALVAAKSDAQLIDAHRDGFRAQRARAEELSVEEAAAEQWTASHFSSRRS